jgi:NADP-dependent 3-hydroxy acid dehydrogenase YdfG
MTMSNEEDDAKFSHRPALTNPMATNVLTTGERHQFCSLQGRGALVTGASGGIGLAIVERLAECGVNVCIVARRVEKLNELKEKLETEYPDVTIFPLQLDVSKTSEEEMLKIPEKVPFQVDILVNNAGLALGTEAVDTNSISDAMTVVNTNIMGVVAFTRAFASGMRERDRGHIVNISSIAGHEAYIGGSIYCATKHAVDAFTRSARHDLRNSKVRVSSVSPGAVRTDFTMTRFKGDVDAEAALYRGFDPMIAEDVADQVIYALSRPMRTQVCDIISLANAQSAARDIHRGD